MIINDEMLEGYYQYKYLGIFFNGNMNFSTHINYITIKAEKSVSMFWKYTKRFTLKISENVNLFKVLVMSVLLYNYNVDICYPWLLKKKDRCDAFYLKHLKWIQVRCTATNCKFHRLPWTGI